MVFSCKCVEHALSGKRLLFVLRQLSYYFVCFVTGPRGAR